MYTPLLQQQASVHPVVDHAEGAERASCVPEAFGSVRWSTSLEAQSVLPLRNAKARIPVCGLIAAYNATELPPAPDRLGLLMGTILRTRITMQGFIVFDDYGTRWSEFADAMGAWLRADRVKVREDVVLGLENAPEAFIGLLEGKNFGKLVVQVARE